GERLEAELRLGELLTAEQVEAGPFEASGVRFRLPTAGDLVAVSGAGSPEEARAALLERCVGGDGELPEALAAAVGERVGAAGPSRPAGPDPDPREPDAAAPRLEMQPAEPVTVERPADAPTVVPAPRRAAPAPRAPVPVAAGPRPASDQGPGTSILVTDSYKD